MRTHLATLGLIATLALAGSADAAVFTVRSTDDTSDGSCTTGHCSLREAIAAANAAAGADTIAFAIPGAGPHLITLLSPLPYVSTTMTIDGTTQPGYAGTPLVGISGAYLSGQSGRGLLLTAANSAVRGLLVGDCPSDGIMIYGTTGCAIEGCWIGLDFNGATLRPNLGSGACLFLCSDCRVGGPDAGGGNVIVASGGADIGKANVSLWGNSSDPLYCRGNIVQGNRIGTNPAGTAALGAQEVGVRLYYQSYALVGGHAPGEGNLISGHADSGILAEGVGAMGNVIEGNFIGTNADGDGAVPNEMGIWLKYGVTGCRIGGPLPGAGNLISGNARMGVVCDGSDHVFQGNRIGTDAAGTAALPNGESGLFFNIYGPSRNLIGGTEAGAGNLISGNGRSGIYFMCPVEPAVAVDNTIQGNIIGADATGLAAIPNAEHGVYLSGPMRTTIGGAATGAGNLLSGNALNGLEINGTFNVMPLDMTVQGNLIGTDSTGDAALPNGGNGVAVAMGARGITFGGVGAGEGNTISGNAGSGVFFYTETEGEYCQTIDILGNRIGVGRSGGALGNGLHGIHFDGFATQTAVGGAGSGEGNVIAHNGGAGVWLQNQYNFGVEVTGNSLRDNGGLGIDLGVAGVNANDDRDPDRGANEQLNHPTLAAAQASVSTLAVTGTLNSVPYQALRLDFYASDAADPSGHGEGARFLGSADVATDWAGNAAWAAVLAAGETAGRWITATAVDSLGDTSEFSNATLAGAAAFSADLDVTLAAQPPTAFIGQPVELRAVVRQLGPDPVSGVVLTETLPAALSFVSAAATRGSCRHEAGVVTCEAGGLAAGDSVVVTVTVVPQTDGVHAVTAAVGGREPDPTPANDAAGVDVMAVPTADLRLAKTASRPYVTPNMPFNYRLAVRNGGPSPATDLALVDHLPYGTALSSLDYDAGQCNCTTAGSPPVVTCTAASLAAGDSAVVTLNVSIGGWYSEANEAVVTAATADPAPANNADSAQVQVVEYGATDIGLTMTDAPDPVVTGSNVVYSLLLTNHGPSEAYNVQVRSYIPGGATFVTATASLGSWSYLSMGRMLTFGMSTLPLDATALLTITLRADAAQDFTLSAVASLYDGGDFNPGNDTANQQTWFKVPPTLVVNSADDVNDGVCDSAHCSLREAIAAANAGPGRDIIGFAIPGAGPHTIALTGAALRVEQPAVIDGAYQPGWAGTPVVALDGSGLDPLQGGYGLLFAADDCEVRGLAVGGCPGEGIYAYDCDRFGAYGNHVGTNHAGTEARPNAKDGILLFFVRDARIGGTRARDANLISGNGTDLQAGVALRGLAADSSRTSDIAVVGNRIGSDVTGAVAIPNSNGVSLFEVSQVAIGGAAAGEGNLISGNAGDGIKVEGQHGAAIAIKGNRIGTDAAGTGDLGNRSCGLRIDYGGTGVSVGGTGAGEGNVVSGNDGGGIVVNAHHCTVEGNLVGTDASGLAAVPNVPFGVGLFSYGAHDNRIGGAAAGARNVISGNAGYGVWVAGFDTHDNAILGNYIGVDATGASALPNAYCGVRLQEASTLAIGGPAPGEGNVISGNGHDGVELTGTYDQTGIRLQGNRIGTDASGLAAVPNGYGGVRLHDDLRRALIGGSAPGEGNLISGNAQAGIVYWSSQNYLAWIDVQGNTIGLDAAGGPLPNGSHGIHFAGPALFGTIGGLEPGEGNVIAHNHGDGVSIEERWVFDVEIAGNSIHDNDGLAIDALNDGPTANDDRDSDRGWDEMQNYPVLTSAVSRGDSVQVSGTLGSALGQRFRVDVYGDLACDPSGHGEARWYLGSIDSVATDSVFGQAAFSAVLPSPSPEMLYLSATAVDSAGNTSELAACLAIPPSTGVEDAPSRLVFRLHGAVPNPFNPSTLLRFDLPRPGLVDLVLYDVSGRRVRTLAREAPLPAGAHAARWDGRDDAGRAVAAGVYFAALRCGDDRATLKLMLLK